MGGTSQTGFPESCILGGARKSEPLLLSTCTDFVANTFRPPCDEGIIRVADPHAAGCAEAAKPWVLAATILGSSLAFINSSVVNVALPAIQSGLGASAAEMQWVINAYLLLLGSLILAGGSAGDIWGRRRIFGWGIAVFTVASVTCGLAMNTGQLIAARAVQGIGGAMLVPSSLALISASFPVGERGRAIGTWSGFSAITTAIGPLLGGWLVDAASWRWVFFVVVPLAAAALAITLLRVPPPRNESGVRLDWTGAVLATLGLAAVTFGLITASERGLGAPVVLFSVGAGVAVLWIFLRAEATNAAPMMPLQLWRSRTFAGANLLTLLLYFALGGLFFFLPFNLIQVQGYSATATGAAFLPFALLMGGLSRWSGGLVERWGAKRPLVLGPLIAAAGFALFALPGIGGSFWTTFFPAMLVLGLGMAVSVAPLTTVVMSSVDDAQAGIASGVNNAVSRVAGTLAVAALGLVAVAVFGSDLDRRVAALDLSPNQKAALLAERQNLANARVPPDTQGTARQAAQGAVDDAFVASFRWITLLSAGLALGGAVCAWWWIEPDSAATRTEQGAHGRTKRPDRS